MAAVAASLKRISLGSIFYRHEIEEDRLVSIMSYVLKNHKWDLPPPLVARQIADGLEYYWVLDGHHRVRAAQLFEASLKKDTRIWAFVVSELNYRQLILTQFGGVEPDAIRNVRDYISTPAGDANMLDSAWAQVGDTLRREISASFPLFVVERSRNAFSNIGFFTAGVTLDGAIWIKDGRSQRTVIKMRNPPTRERVTESEEIRIRGGDGEDFEIEIEAQWDYSKKVVDFGVRSKGIRLTRQPIVGQVLASPIVKNLTLDRDQLYAQSRVIMSAVRRVNRDFDGIVVEGLDDPQREAPWFLLDEFEFKQPETEAAPEPQGFKRGKKKTPWARRDT
jgi:hypothetical protein